MSQRCRQRLFENKIRGQKIHPWLGTGGRAGTMQNKWWGNHFGPFRAHYNIINKSCVIQDTLSSKECYTVQDTLNSIVNTLFNHPYSTVIKKRHLLIATPVPMKLSMLQHRLHNRSRTSGLYSLDARNPGSGILAVIQYNIQEEEQYWGVWNSEATERQKNIYINSTCKRSVQKTIFDMWQKNDQKSKQAYHLVMNKQRKNQQTTYAASSC